MFTIFSFNYVIRYTTHKEVVYSILPREVYTTLSIIVGGK